MRKLGLYQRTITDTHESGESKLVNDFNEEASQAGIKEENIISMNIDTVIPPKQKNGSAVECTLYVFYWKDN